MSEEKEGLQYRIFSVEEVDKQFQSILLKTNPAMSHVQINEIIHEELYNRIMIMRSYDIGSPKLSLNRITSPFNGFDPNNLSHYSHPPAEMTFLGRANIDGNPVLYCTVDAATALREMKGQLKIGAKFYLSVWEISFKRHVLAHTLIYNSKSVSENSIVSKIALEQEAQMNEMVSNIPTEAQEGFIHSIKKMGDMFSTQGSEIYHITAAYSHKLLYEAKRKKMDVSWIMYPSIANDHNSVNFALHPDFVSEMMSIKQVFELTVANVHEDSINVSIHKKGNIIGHRIQWSVPSYKIERIDYFGVELATYNGEVFKGEEVFELQINNKISAQEFIKMSVEEFRQKALPGLFTEEKLDALNFAEQTFEHLVMAEFEHGREVQTKKGRSCIHRLLIPVSWSCGYEAI